MATKDTFPNGGNNFLATPFISPFFFNKIGAGGATQNSAPRPVIADNGSIVARVINGTSNEIKLFSNDLSSSELIAGPGNGFTNVGIGPGISDDGKVITFAGIAGAGSPLNPGPGIFVAVQSTNGWTIKRIAGVSGNGYLDNGEAFDDLNGNGKFDTGMGEIDKGSFSEFSIDDRIAISNSRIVMFKATGVDGNIGAYVGSVFSGVSPSLILKKGDTISGLSGSVQNIGIYDSINNNPVNDPMLALWLDLGSNNYAVVRAPLCQALR